MFQNILVPVDFTPKNKIALKIAGELAGFHRARISLIHVIERIEHIPEAELKGFYQKLRKSAYTKMKALIRSLEGASARIYQEIRIGNRTEEIVRYAERRKMDLIILNSHKIEPKKKGRGWGTLSYKVALLSSCPVMLVK